MIQFQVKVCGVTRSTDIHQCVRAGADAIGLNFYAPSPRSIDLATAKVLVGAIPNSVAKVGVFVNHSVEEVTRIVEGAPLDYAQLHGDETIEFADELMSRGISVIKVLRVPGVDEGGRYDLERLVDEFGPLASKWSRRGVEGLLLDTLKTNAYGGTGTAFPWALLPKLEVECPIVLAGGLTPENVAEAIAEARPQAVDVASGVEAEPGVKSATKVHEFVAASKMAFLKSR